MRTTVLGAVLAVIGAAAAACHASDQAVTTAPATSSAGPNAAPSPPPVQASPTNPSARGVTITDEGARAHKLPPMGFSVDTEGTSLLASPLPDHGDSYLYLSGPPGGPLGVGFLPYAGSTEKAEIERFVQQQFDKSPPLVMGKISQIDFAGGKRTTIAFKTGASMAEATNCGIVLPPSATRRATGLFVVFDRGGSQDCAAMLASDPFDRIAKSFRITSP